MLECRVRGNPRPTITWYKDGEELQTNNDKYTQLDQYDGFCKLLIAHPSKADNGTYACQATNPGNSEKIQHFVEFCGKDQAILERAHGFYHRDPNKPHFSQPLSDLFVPINGSVGLQVEVHGPIDIQWLKNNTPITASETVKPIVDGGGVYTLAVIGASAKESGKYTCRATNAFGRTDTSSNVHIVAPATVKGGKPAQIQERPPKEMVLLEGDKFMVSFRGLGDPKPAGNVMISLDWKHILTGVDHDYSPPNEGNP